MAKATITLEDNEDGGTDVSLVFDPEVKKDEIPTTAQWLAMEMMKVPSGSGGEEE